MLDDGADRPSELRRVVRVLRERVWLIVGTTALCAVAALGLSALQAPTYVATAELVISPQEARGLFDSDAGAYRDPTRTIQTQIQVILGQGVRDAVADEVGDPASVEAQAVGLTDAVEITASSTDPELAAATANAYAKAFIAYRSQQTLETLDAAEEELTAKIAELQGQIDELDQSIAAIDGLDLAGLIARRDALIDQQAGFSQRLDQIVIDASIQGDSAELVSPAVVPTDPASPKPVRNALFGGVLGLLLGVALAFAMDRFDDSIRTKGDLNRVAGDLPVVATIPDTSTRRGSGQSSLLRSTDPRVSEGYRALRTAMELESLNRPVSTIQVAGATDGESASSTATNLAAALADSGERVILVSGDLRGPRTHDLLGLPNEEGFAAVLMGQAEVANVTRQIVGRPNMTFMGAGQPPPNPTELLTSSALEQVLAQLAAMSDIVVIDGPAVFPDTDAAILAQQVDVTLLVVEAGSTSAPEVGDAIDRLRAVDAPLVGVVLDGAKEF